jgi:hypothetical protein
MFAGGQILSSLEASVRLVRRYYLVAPTFTAITYAQGAFFTQHQSSLYGLDKSLAGLTG